MWRTQYPDAAQAARRRRSKAARLALQSLRGGRDENADAKAKRAAAVLNTYLWQRLDVPMANATPSQAGAQLRRLGVPEPLSEQVADLFRSCDAARFGRTIPSTSDHLTTVTEKLILSLESQPWLAQ